METTIKTNQKTIAIELAEIIATLNISKIADLLSENGDYYIQDEKDEIVISNKANFINLLSSNR